MYRDQTGASYASQSASLVALQGAANLIGIEASSGEETRAPRPLRPIERVRFSETTSKRSPGLIPPGGVAFVQTGGTDFVIDPPTPELLANTKRPVAPCATGGSVLLREALIGQPVSSAEFFENSLDRLRIESARRQLVAQLGARVLTTCEQFERLSVRPLERIVSAQASTSSGLLAFASSVPSNRSRSAESRLEATSSCSLRKLRTLSRPCPIRSPR